MEWDSEDLRKGENKKVGSCEEEEAPNHEHHYVILLEEGILILSEHNYGKIKF